jgi:PAS domain S-box-containing protein
MNRWPLWLKPVLALLAAALVGVCAWLVIAQRQAVLHLAKSDPTVLIAGCTLAALGGLVSLAVAYVQHRAGVNDRMLLTARADATRLAAIVEGADEAIFSKALDGTITFWNEAATRLFGYSAEEMIGQTEDRLVPALRKVEEEHIMAQLHAGVRIRQFESVRLRRDGRALDISLTASLVRSSSGDVIGSSRIIRDISRKKKMEGMVNARLRLMELAQRNSSADFYQLALDEIEQRTGSAIGFFHILNSDQETIHLQAWSTRTVRTMCSAEPTDRHYSVSQAGVWCDCVRRRQPVIHNDYASMIGKKGLPVGHAALARELVVPIFRGDQIVAIVGVGNKPSDYDLSDVEIVRQLGDFSWEVIERKQAEEALQQSVSLLQATLDSTADGILVVDTCGNVTSFNQRFVQLWGIPEDRSFPLNNQALLEYVACKLKDPEAFIARVAEVDRQPTHNSLDSIVLRDGRELERYSRPQLVEGNPVGRVWSFRDVTAQRKAEREQEKLFAELTRSNADLEQFAFVASHDLKSPLRAIDSLSAWLEEDLGATLTGESQKHLRYLRQRAKRMEKLLDDLLAYSRAGRTPSEVRSVALGPLVQEIVDLLNVPSAFDVRVVESGPTIYTAVTPLQQVVTNLIANAIKHHDRPSGNIELAASDAGDFYEFTVADDGPGIPPEYHERIFGMFQTLRPRDEVEGSGIGLALVKRIVTRFGGTVSIECRTPRGSLFRVRWPKELAA